MHFPSFTAGKRMNGVINIHPLKTSVLIILWNADSS